MLPNITSPVALSIILLSFLPFLRVFLPLQPRLTLIFIGLRAIAMTNPVIIIGTCSQERIMILTIQMPRSSFDDVFFKLGHPGYGYHLPSRWELTGVFSYSGNTQYDSPTNTSNVNEAIEFGGIKKTFANDYFSSGNGVCYALRFKQGTGNPIDDSSLSDFPLATDNNMVCAYRYTRVGSFANHDFTSLLKVDCVYLGSAFTGNISTINNDSWWDSHTSEAVVRIFPAAGYISFPTFISSGLLEARGEYGRYWSSTEFPSLLGNAWNVSFYSYSAFANYRDVKHHGFSVRLFADK